MFRRLGIRFRAPTPHFLRSWMTMRAFIRIWAEFIGGTVVFSVLFAPVAILVFIAIILTLALPIALLLVWGRSLDEELGWQDRIGR